MGSRTALRRRATLLCWPRTPSWQQVCPTGGDTEATESDVAIYVALADHHEKTGEAALRDRYLVLAADAALTAGRPVEAERLRQRLLRNSRSHLLGPFQSFVHAQSTPDVQLLLGELRRSCPPKEARRLLDAPAPRPNG